jgi:hypothetical protein
VGREAVALGLPGNAAFFLFQRLCGPTFRFRPRLGKLALKGFDTSNMVWPVIKRLHALKVAAELRMHSQHVRVNVHGAITA